MGLEALGPEKAGVGRETAPIWAIVGSGVKGGAGVGETGRDRVSGRKEGKGHLELGGSLGPSRETQK